MATTLNFQMGDNGMYFAEATVAGPYALHVEKEAPEEGKQGTFAIYQRSVDSEGNPKYVLSLVLEKGDKGEKGEPPVIEEGTISTGEPGTSVSATITPNGETEDGKPKYRLSLTIPQGDQGDPGKKVNLRKGTTGIEWKYEDESEWQTLVPMADLSFTFEELTDEQKQEISRKPILGTVEATKGDEPSGSFTADGTDDHGNPRYKLILTLPKGDKGEKGEPPVIEMGTVTTGEPGTEADVEVVPSGETEGGNLKYVLNFTIPKGDHGDGSGNVLVAETGIVAGKEYLFKPGADNSAEGTLVEYVEPEIPDVPQWAMQATKPSYTAQEVGALPDSTKIPSKLSDLENDKSFITYENYQEE